MIFVKVQYSLIITSTDEAKITAALGKALPLLTKEVKATIELKLVDNIKQQVSDEK